MKTEAQVKEILKETKKLRKVVQKRYYDYDGYEDMHQLEQIDVQISIIKVILENK